MERLEKEKLKSGTGDRTASAMGSQASMHDDRSTAGTHHTPLIPEQWQDKMRDFRSIFVIKYPRIIQTLFYLLRFRERDYICEKGTNKLSWKKAKVFINDDLFAKMGEYWAYGPKDEEFKEYEKLQFIQNNLKGIQEDAVDEYSVALGKLYRWVVFAIDIRIEDIRQRRENKKELRAMRAEAMEKERERQEKRAAQFEEAKLAFDEKAEADYQQDKADRAAEAEAAGEGDADPEEPGDDDSIGRAQFDAEEWYERFDDENRPVDIPEEIIDDIDNDCNIEIKAKEEEE